MCETKLLVMILSDTYFLKICLDSPEKEQCYSGASLTTGNSSAPMERADKK